jgi:hypothetical protein
MAVSLGESLGWQRNEAAGGGKAALRMRRVSLNVRLGWQAVFAE